MPLIYLLFGRRRWLHGQRAENGLKKFRNYGISKFEWPKVGTLDRFFSKRKTRQYPPPNICFLVGAVGFVANAPKTV